MNYKIKVGSEAESKEVQELFFELGGKWKDSGRVILDFDRIMPFYYLDGEELHKGSCLVRYQKGNREEITLPQLRDLVVLKRNSIDDATHEDYSGLKHLLLTHTRHVWGGDNWLISTADFSKFKPITKEESMKREFLVKKTDENYKLIDWGVEKNPPDYFIEVPEGAESFNYFDNKDNLFFLMGGGEEAMFSNELNDWDWKPWGDIEFDGVICLWSREPIDKNEQVLKEILEGGSIQHESKKFPNKIEGEWLSDEKHSHYKKDVSHLDVIDIYRVTELFSPHACGAHIAKKALCSGQRGHKDLLTDIQDIIDTAERWKEMLIEDENSCKD